MIVGQRTAGKADAFYQYTCKTPGASKNCMGLSLVNTTFRYTEYVGFNQASSQPDFSRLFAVELYAHADGDILENINVADDPR